MTINSSLFLWMWYSCTSIILISHGRVSRVPITFFLSVPLFLTNWFVYICWYYRGTFVFLRSSLDIFQSVFVRGSMMDITVIPPPPLPFLSRMRVSIKNEHHNEGKRHNYRLQFINEGEGVGCWFPSWEGGMSGQAGSVISRKYGHLVFLLLPL